MAFTDEQRAVINDAMLSVAERADELKAACCALGGEWPDAEDKVIYDAECALVERLRAMLTTQQDNSPCSS